VEEAIYLSDRVVVMEPRPGRVRRIVPVPLAHPRNRVGIDFAQVKEDVLREFAGHTDVQAPVRLPAERPPYDGSGGLPPGIRFAF
jgi:sulfonate transport system ATP-binding protein